MNRYTVRGLLQSWIYEPPRHVNFIRKEISCLPEPWLHGLKRAAEGLDRIQERYQPSGGGGGEEALHRAILAFVVDVEMIARIAKTLVSTSKAIHHHQQLTSQPRCQVSEVVY
jgi:hypothetical protein